MVRYCLIATEGPHDQAVVNKVFCELQYEEFNGKADKLDPYWRLFIPTYPASNDLYKRLSFPTVLQSDTHSIAIYLGEGGKLKRNLVNLLSVKKELRRSLHAFGIVVDADNNDPHKIAREWCDALQGIYPDFPDAPNSVRSNHPKLGLFVLPDNTSKGVLDKVMCACAKNQYPVLWDAAEAFIEKVIPAHSSHWKPFDKEKALCAAVTSVLRPGRTNTASYKSDRWVSSGTFDAITDLRHLRNFLQDLIA